MATSLGAYAQLLLKVNRDDSNSNIHVPRGKFVTIFNEQQRRWLLERLDKDVSSDDLDNLSDLLVDDDPLEKVRVHRDHVEFTLPRDFVAFSSSYSLATRGECTNRVLVNWNTKSKNLRIMLQNANESPSFDYEETLVSIASGKFRVYFTDFLVDEAFLSYYRYAKNIDLEGYVDLNGQPSQNIDPELEDGLVDEIIDRCAAEIMRNNQNAEGFGFAKERIQTKP
jgi:hypothetical protein